MHHSQAEIDRIWKDTLDGRYASAGVWGPHVVVNDAWEHVLSVPIHELTERISYRRKPPSGLWTEVK